MLHFLNVLKRACSTFFVVDKTYWKSIIVTSFFKKEYFFINEFLIGQWWKFCYDFYNHLIFFFHSPHVEMILGYTTHSRRELVPSSSHPRKKLDGVYLLFRANRDCKTVGKTVAFLPYSKGAKRRKRDPRSWSRRVSPFPHSLQTFRSNRPFPCSLVPLFQNESKCETFHMIMSFACSFIFMQIKVIFIRKVSHLDSLWNRGTRELGNGLYHPRRSRSQK